MFHEVWGQMDYPSGLGRNPVQIWHCMFTYWATTLYPGPLFTSKQNRSTSCMIRNRLKCWKPDLVELGFPPFLAPFCWFFKGKWAKMGYLTNYCSVLPHYFCWYDILYENADYSYKNHTNQVSWWWDMTDWWWKVGFTPRAIRQNQAEVLWKEHSNA